MVHLKNMALMGSLFPLVLVSFEEISLMDEVPGLQFNTPTKKTILSKLLLRKMESLRFQANWSRHATDFDQNHQHPCSVPPFYA